MKGLWFDGGSSKGVEAELEEYSDSTGKVFRLFSPEKMVVYLKSECVSRTVPGSKLGIVEFPDYSRFETTDLVELSKTYPIAGVPSISKLSVLSLATLLLGVGFYIAIPKGGSLTHKLIPRSWVVAMSNSVIEELNVAVGLEQVTMGPNADWAKNAEKSMHSDFKDLNIQVQVFKTKTPFMNAFALPDGRIVMIETLMEKIRDSDQRWSVVYHEVGHIYHEHVFRAMLQSLGTSFVVSHLAGHETAGQVAAQLLNLGYSRAEESEADQFSIAELKRKGIVPDKFGEALKLITQENPNSMIFPALLSSHPETAERIKAAQASGTEKNTPR